MILTLKKGGDIKKYPGSGTKDDCYYKALKSYGPTTSAYRSGAISACRKKKLSKKYGGSLNQGDSPMEFTIKENKNTDRKHTLDGYRLEGTKLKRDIKSSINGYLQPVKKTEGMNQYGENLYSKFKKGGTFSNGKNQGLREWFTFNNK